MLTKNFYSCLRARLGESATVPITETDGNFQANGGFEKFAPVLPFDAMNRYSSSDTNVGTCFGSGSTPATVDDYRLEQRIDSGISVTTQTRASCTSTETYMEYSATFGVTNTGTEDKTIAEIGLIISGHQTNYTTRVLVDRTVLDKPVTIPAGQSKQITYTIRFNYGV